ncbi:MAG: hypothetical protein CMI60_03300 [Parvibaculum sp.]|nr:hypothetical protein [Parvibaculum sp.]
MVHIPHPQTVTQHVYLIHVVQKIKVVVEYGIYQTTEPEEHSIIQQHVQKIVYHTNVVQQVKEFNGKDTLQDVYLNHGQVAHLVV